MKAGGWTMPNSTALKKEGVVSNVFSRGTWEICAVQAAVAPFGMLCPGRTFRAILSGFFFFLFIGALRLSLCKLPPSHLVRLQAPANEHSLYKLCDVGWCMWTALYTGTSTVARIFKIPPDKLLSHGHNKHSSKEYIQGRGFRFGWDLLKKPKQGNSIIEISKYFNNFKSLLT